MEQELENKKTDDMGDESLKKRKRRQRLSMVAIVLVLAAVSAGCITVYLRTRKSQDAMSDQGFGNRNGGGYGGENIVTATGTTSVGIDAVTFDIDFLEDTSLYVEEVYLESGDEVDAGTKYLKLTDDSVADARKELESALLTAQLEYRSGVISNQESLILAKYDYDLALMEANQAQGVYDDTLANLEVELNKAKEAYDEANEDYNELYEAIENNTFYEDYNVAELKKAYEDAMDLYDNRMAYWGLSEDDLTSSSQDSMGGTGTSGTELPTLSGDVNDDDTRSNSTNSDSTDSSSTDSDRTDSSSTDSGSTDSDRTDSGSTENNNTGNDNTNKDNTENSGTDNTAKPAEGNQSQGQGQGQEQGGQKPGGKTVDTAQLEQNWILKAAKLIKAEYEEAEEEYEQALSDYEDARDSAELDIQQLYLALETAREDYEDAQLKYLRQSQSAKTKYETAVVKGETAQLDYETQLTSLEEQLDKLKDAKDEAQDNLATFEATVGDGYLYTQEAGTILMVMTREDNALTGGEMLFAYSNPEKISVSVSVSQDYIAQLYVGENATVMIDDYGTYTGTVQTINPVSSSDTRTSVYYTVTVLLDTDDISGLSANLTATVMFGDVEIPQEMDGQPEMDGQSGMDGQPGMENQQGGQMSDEMGQQPNMEQPGTASEMGNMNDQPQGEKHE